MPNQTTALFLCENFIVDINNNVSIINIFTNVILKKLPNSHLFKTYFHITGVEGEQIVRITVTSPSGEETVLSSKTINVDTKKQLLHLTEDVQLTYEVEGIYVFKSFVNGENTNELYVSVEAKS